MNKAVFLDRDGVLNELVMRMGKRVSPRFFDEFVLIPEAISSVMRLRKAGYLCVVVTNQPDISRGQMAQEQLDLMSNHLKLTLKVDDVLVCVHDDGECNCRKPAPGLLLTARERHRIDFSKSWIVGDRYSDIEAGKRVGVRGVLITGGQNDNQTLSPGTQDVPTVGSLRSAVDVILGALLVY